MKTTLYLGTDPLSYETQGRCEGNLIHYPVIKIVPRKAHTIRAYRELSAFTHIIFTSKNAVNVFFQHLADLELSLHQQQLIAIGAVTAAHLSKQGFPPQHVAEQETQEGVIALLKQLDLKEAFVFLPRSSQARPLLVQFFEDHQIRYCACDLYDTVTQKLEVQPDWDQIDEIVFTSPTTVRAFLEIFKKFPEGKQLTPIGQVTNNELLISQKMSGKVRSS